MVKVVESLEEMVSLRGSQDSEIDTDDFKENALSDFKSKHSDTHRPDKVRKTVRRKPELIRPALKEKNKLLEKNTLEKESVGNLRDVRKI